MTNRLPSGLLFGVAYYPGYPCTDLDDIPERVRVDLALMRASDINVIRVGESVWSPTLAIVVTNIALLW